MPPSLLPKHLSRKAVSSGARDGGRHRWTRQVEHRAKWGAVLLPALTEARPSGPRMQLPTGDGGGRPEEGLTTSGNASGALPAPHSPRNRRHEDPARSSSPTIVPWSRPPQSP